MITMDFVGIRQWLNGAKGFQNDILADVEKAWAPVTDRAYDMTQNDVHVISGDLKRSGYVLTPERDRTSVTVGVQYNIEYSIYEWARGGDHDFITPTEAEFTPEYAETLLDAIAESVNGW